MSYDINICYYSRAYKYLKKLNHNEQDQMMRLIDQRVKRYIEDGDKRYIDVYKRQEHGCSFIVRKEGAKRNGVNERCE